MKGLKRRDYEHICKNDGCINTLTNTQKNGQFQCFVCRYGKLKEYGRKYSRTYKKKIKKKKKLKEKREKKIKLPPGWSKYTAIDPAIKVFHPKI